MKIFFQILVYCVLGVILIMSGCILDRMGTLKRMIGDHMYTISTDEISNVVPAAGYHSEGVIGYVYPGYEDITSGIGTDAVPFYRLFHPAGGDHFYTTSLSERDQALAGGYIEDNYCGIYEDGAPACTSIACLIFPSDYIPQIAEGLPFYRLYNPVTQDHLYTISEVERKDALAAGYINDGVPVVGGIYEIDHFFGNEPSESISFYRLYHPGTNDHFYTTNKTEKDAALVNGYIDDGYCKKYEDGEDNCVSYAGMIFSNNASPGVKAVTIPFFRLYNPSSNDHFYTTDEFERKYAIDNYGYIDDQYCDNYEQQGAGCVSIAGRIFPVKTELVPLYRLYHPGIGDHAYTTLLSEKDKALSVGYEDEGIAGYIFPTQQLGTFPLYRLSNGTVWTQVSN